MRETQKELLGKIQALEKRLSEDKSLSDYETRVLTSEMFFLTRKLYTTNLVLSENKTSDEKLVKVR